MQSRVFTLGRIFTLSVCGLIGCGLFGTSDEARDVVVVNGSFEENDHPSLSGWMIPTDNGQPHGAAPQDGGKWSLALRMGNVQTCPGGNCPPFLGKAYQVVPQIHSGDVVRVSAWARQPAGRRGYTRLYWTTFEGDSIRNGELYPLPNGPVDSTSSSEWILLSVVDTLYINQDDSAGIILDAGWTSGPESPDDWSNFDLVSVEKLASK